MVFLAIKLLVIGVLIVLLLKNGRIDKWIHKISDSWSDDRGTGSAGPG